VLSQGHSLGRYQAILVNQLMGMQIIGLTNNLNFALNTNRLKMMTKKKTSAIKRLKFVWTLPVLALLLFAFAKPSYQVKDPVVTDTDISILEVAGKKTINVAGLVLDENSKPMPGASIVIKGSTKGTVSDLNGKFKLDVPDNSKIVISFVGKESTEIEVISRGKEINNAKFTFIMKDAVIVIDTEIPPPPPPPIVVEVLTIVEDEPEEKEVFFIVEDMPQYPGGRLELISYVKKMQKKITIQKKVKGNAKVAFTVDNKGKVTDIKIVEKDNDGVAKGAYAIAEGMEDWTPGKQRGKAVPVKYLLPVEFK